MPQRPDDPDESGQEYGWLYGGRGSGDGSRQSSRSGSASASGSTSGSGSQRSSRPAPSGHRGEDPEATRMLPQFERSGATRAAGGAGGAGGAAAAGAAARSGERATPRREVRPAEPVAPPRDPGRSGGSTSGRGGRRGGRGRTVRRVVLLLLVVWVVFLIAVPLWAWSKVTKVDAFPTSGRPDSQPGTTYLLVGSDSRKGLSARQNRRLGTGGVGDVGQRTDTIMLLHTGSGPNLLLSIPRDSLVPVPGHGTTKINSAFTYGGPKLLVQTIEQNTGVHIDHYVEIGFGGFVNSVNAVGGVTICPTKRMVDPRANLDIKKGCQEVRGVKALGYARSRHTSGLGDIDRAKHQREVVSAVGAKVKSPWTVLNPFRYYAVAKAGASSLTVSKGSSPFSLVGFAWAMTHVNGDAGLTCSMPIRDLAVHWDRTRALALMKLIKEDRTGDVTKRLCTTDGESQ